MEVWLKYNIPSFYDEEDLSAFRRFLGAPPEGEREAEERGVYGRIFTKAENHGDSVKLKVRRRPVSFGDLVNERPLFSGNLNAPGRRVGGLISCPVTAFLHLNPTEAANLNLTGLRSSDRISALTSRSESNPLRSLDGKENVLSEVMDRGAYETAESRYFEAVTEGLRQELSRAFRLAQGGLDELEAGSSPSALSGASASLIRLSPRVVETYWEFSVDDAPAFLERITSRLESFHKNVQVRSHGTLSHAIDRRTDGNQTSIRLFISESEEILVYAKLGNRVRFEVRHRPGKNGRLLDGPMVATDLESFFGKLRQLKQKAANRVNQLLEFLETWDEMSPANLANQTEFIVRWAASVGGDRGSLALLETLRQNGRIVGGSGLGEDEARALKRAKNLGLVRSNGRGLYHPCSEIVRLTEPAPAPNLSHAPVTQPLQSEDVSSSFSRVKNAGRRVPPSPPSLCFAKRKLPGRGGSRTPGFITTARQRSQNSEQSEEKALVVREAQDNSRPRLHRFARLGRRPNRVIRLT